MPRKLKIVLASLIGLALTGYGGLCLLVYLKQDSLTYFPRHEIVVKPSDFGIAFESFDLDLQESSVTGWLVRSQPQAPWILICHGNGGNICDRIDYLALFQRLGFNAAVFDYRGYGQSRGRPSEAGLTEDALAVRSYLLETQKVSPENLVYFGESLGGAVACALAEKEAPAGLILKSTFTSYPAMGQLVYPFLPVRLLATSKFDSATRVATFDIPILVMHGPADEVIPYRLGRQLFEQAGGKKSWLELSGTHNTGPLELGPEFAETIQTFVNDLPRQVVAPVEQI